MSLLGAVLLGTSRHAVAGAYTPWGSTAAYDTVALSPYLVVAPDGTLVPSPYAFFGLRDGMDFMIGYTEAVGPATGTPSASAGAIEFMPRKTLKSGIILAPHLLYIPGEEGTAFAMEAHGSTGAGGFALTWNTGWRAALGQDGATDQSAFLVFAPEMVLSEQVSLFAEVNPALALPVHGGVLGWSMQVVPGVTVRLDDVGSHFLTAAAIITVAGEDSQAAMGLLYCGSLDLHPPPKPSVPHG